MAGRFFALGRFADAGEPFVGIVLDDRVVSLAEASILSKDCPVAPTVDDLLSDWDHNFARLAAAVRCLDDAPGTPVAALRVLAPITRPPRVLNAAANYRAHVAGMRQSFTNGLPPVDQGAALPTLEPYLFAKVCPVTGPHDDIVIPHGMDRIDWEAELAVVIGRPGRNIPRARAVDHIAGYMTGNDVSCRDRTWREDRPALRSDWLTGKSYDSFSPIGPLFVPRIFVADHANLRIRLWVNGALKQDGNSGDMIFAIEDQIRFASEMMALLPGDILHTGTPAGTGQELGEFLKVGDIVETEVELCGRQRNRVTQGSSNYWSG